MLTGVSLFGWPGLHVYVCVCECVVLYLQGVDAFFRVQMKQAAGVN